MAIMRYTIDDYLQLSSMGSIESSIANDIYGINHRQSQKFSPPSKTRMGMYFFVRPQLNLTTNNIRNTRELSALLNSKPDSMHRVVRCLLDPRLMYIDNLACPLVDPLNAFIPGLTNRLLTLTGWPSLTAPYFTSNPPGLYNEVYSQVDGIAKNYEAYTIECTFRNTIGDFISYLFYIWVMYETLVASEGLLVPYPDFLARNRLDYNTRIYGINLDSTSTYVDKIVANGVSFPNMQDIGRFFDFNQESPFNTQSKDIPIRFQCLGVNYFDDIIIEEFNQVVQVFNPNMRDRNRKSSMVKLNRAVLDLFDNRGYPRIDYETNELEWWVAKDLYQQRMKNIESIKKRPVS